MGAGIAGACLGTVLAVLALAPLAGAAEFRANTFTTGDQGAPAVAKIGGGGFVVVWVSAGQDGSGLGVYGQRYAANGAKAGLQFRVNTTTAADQKQPSVIGLSGGGFLVVWASNHLNGLDDVYGQRYSATGVKQGGQFRINTFTASNQINPAAAALLNNAFVVAWSSDTQDGSGNGVYGQRFLANGAKQGPEFRVNTFTLGSQHSPAVSRFGPGSAFVVAWASLGQDGNGNGVYAQLYSAAGAKNGGAFRVNTLTAGSQRDAAIARLQNGSFVIAFSSENRQGDVLMQRFSAAGAKVGANIRVNTYTERDQQSPSITGIGTGGFVVLWQSHDQDGSGRGIYGQRYAPNGLKVGAEFRVNEVTDQDQERPSVAPWSTNGFVGLWDSELQDGSELGVFGKRFPQ